MDDQTFKVLIVGFLASGCGVVNQGIMWQLVKWKEEEGDAVSAKTKRRLSLLLAGVTPSVLYGFIVWMGWEVYGVAAHMAYVGLAYGIHQALHGELRLPNREQERVAERVKERMAYVRAEKAVTSKAQPIPLGHTPPEARIQFHPPHVSTYMASIGYRDEDADTDYSNSGDVQSERGPSGGL